MFKTKITEMFGIEYPIILGPMGRLSHAELVSAVSNAGGLGTLVSTTFENAKDFQEEIKKTKSMTDKPFAVNVTLMPTARPISYEDYFNAAIDEGVKIIETSGRSPEPYMKMLKDAGVKLIHRATRTRDVRTGERVGADAITILGCEAAGHLGIEDVGTIVRVPIAIDAVKIPIIAAGGIADARGFVAALALGADAVMMGTRFMVSKESPMHQKIKDSLLELQEQDTIIIQRTIRTDIRVIRTDFTQKIRDMELKGATLEELMPLISGRRGESAYDTGDASEATVAVGQNVGLIHDVPSVQEIMDSLISEAKVIMQRLHNLGVAG